MLLTNIRQLVNIREQPSLLRGAALADLPCLDNAYLVAKEGRIEDYGKMKDLRLPEAGFTEQIDCTGRLVLPAWCDSHTHAVFAGTREDEFVEKIRGRSYAEIAARGGGIRNTAAKVAAAGEEALYQAAHARLNDLMLSGTGAIEIKSGYGLTVEGELKMLRVIRRLKDTIPIPVKATFLGAHSLPEGYKDRREGYIQLILEDLLPRVVEEGLADFIDVFCEQGFFTPEETERICAAGAAAGLKPKIHANQLQVSGGVQAGVRSGALSVDHLERMDEHSIRSLATSATIGTLLPTAAFFLRMPYGPARDLIDAGCAIALASDFNPGSSPSGNMNFVVALSCIGMRMLPEETINAATINGAYAMDLEREVGSITRGKRANLIITRPIPSLAYLPYAFGQNHIECVLINGKPVKQSDVRC